MSSRSSVTAVLVSRMFFFDVCDCFRAREPGQFEDFKAKSFSAVLILQWCEQEKECVLESSCCIERESICVWLDEEGKWDGHFGLVFLVKALALNKISFWYNALLTSTLSLVLIIDPLKHSHKHWQSSNTTPRFRVDSRKWVDVQTCDCCNVASGLKIDDRCPWQLLL